MKIIYITLENLSLNKGPSTHIKEVIKRLAKRGHKITLIGRSQSRFNIGSDNSDDMGYQVHFLTIPSMNQSISVLVSAVILILYLFKLMKSYDVVYARDYHATIVGLIPKILFHKPIIFEVNGLAHIEQALKKGNFLNRALCFLLKRAEITATRSCDRVITVTSAIASYLASEFKCPQEKVKVIGNGVDSKRFFPIQDQDVLWNIRQNLRITSNDFVVIFVGNLARWQGVDILIQSATYLLKAGINIKTIIVGDGPLKDEVIELVRQTQFPDKFILTGSVCHRDIPRLINVAHVGAAPFVADRNRRTGVSPLKVFEYLSCGKPVVSTTLDGLEFIEKEKIGRLVEPGDPLSFASALRDFIENPRAREDAGRRAREIAVDHFDWEFRTREVELLLLDAVGQNK